MRSESLSLPACTALAAFPLRLRVSSAYMGLIQGKKNPEIMWTGQSLRGIKRGMQLMGLKTINTIFLFIKGGMRKCCCCKGILSGQGSKTYNHVIMMSPVHVSSPLLFPGFLSLSTVTHQISHNSFKYLKVCCCC